MQERKNRGFYRATQPSTPIDFGKAIKHLIQKNRTGLPTLSAEDVRCFTLTLHKPTATR